MRLMNAGKLFAVVTLGAAMMFAAAPQKSKEKAETSKGDKAKGEEVFKAANCAICHFTDKTDKRIGPGLKDLFKHEKLQNGKPVNDANVRDVITNGSGKMMPFKEKLDKKQIDDVIAYLHTL